MLTHTMFSQGDTSHDIYKWHADQRRQAGRVRSTSFAGPSHPPPAAFEHIHEPGGFRRNYMILRANEQGAEEPQILNNFIDFLLLFGHFVCPTLLQSSSLVIPFSRLERTLMRTKMKTKRTMKKPTQAYHLRR